MGDLLRGLASGVDATGVAQVARYGFADASHQGITLIALQAVAVLDTLLGVPLAYGVRSAEDTATTSGRNTSITHIPLELRLAPAHSGIAEGILPAVLIGLALGSQLATEAITLVSTITLALGLAQLLVVLACGMRITDFGSLYGNKKLFDRNAVRDLITTYDGAGVVDGLAGVAIATEAGRTGANVTQLVFIPVACGIDMAIGIHIAGNCRNRKHEGI